jgi:hypothetical protein
MHKSIPIDKRLLDDGEGLTVGVPAGLGDPGNDGATIQVYASY